MADRARGDACALPLEGERYVLDDVRDAEASFRGRSGHHT